MLNTVGGGGAVIKLTSIKRNTLQCLGGNVFLSIDVNFIIAPPPPKHCNVFLLIDVNFITAPPPPTVFSVGMYFFQLMLILL